MTTSHDGTVDAESSVGGTASDGGTGPYVDAAGASGKFSGMLTCAQAQKGYALLSAALLSGSASTSCSVYSDCGFVPTSDCGDACSIAIVNKAAGTAISSQLDAFAKANCESCKFPVLPCPSPPSLTAIQCIAGTCSLTSGVD
jgi:hypothetical protein